MWILTYRKEMEVIEHTTFNPVKIMILIEAILSGVWATLIMDFLARFLSGRGLIYPFIIPEAMGRWFLTLAQ